MARQLRREYEGAIYHVMNRGDRKELIFQDQKDRLLFLKTFDEACLKTNWQVHAYCLMSNHFHAVIETPLANLVAGMKWFLGTYTQRFNLRHAIRGHLFAGRYKALHVDNSDSFYLRAVCDYVHLNPARAGLIGEGLELSSFPWSSYPQYLLKPKERPEWLRVDRLLGELGIRQDGLRGREKFRTYMEGRVKEGKDPLWDTIRESWKFGSDDFGDRLALVDEPLGERRNYQAPAYLELMEVKGCRILAEELERRKLTEKALKLLPKTHRFKAEISAQIRKETTLSMRWIAEKLCAGTPGTLAVTLHKNNLCQ